MTSLSFLSSLLQVYQAEYLIFQKWPIDYNVNIWGDLSFVHMFAFSFSATGRTMEVPEYYLQTVAAA